MPTDTVSIAQFVKVNGIEMTCTRVDRNPSMPDSENMDHWKCILTRRDHTGIRYNARKDGTSIVARMTVYFSMGYGHKGAEPKVEDVLDCIASDSSMAADSFEDFCGNCGYDSDSRKAEKTYKTIQHQAARLNNFLGSSRYDELLYNTERM